MNHTPLSIAALLVSLSALSQASTVFYQSDFTGTDLASAGLAQAKFNTSSNWIINTTDDRLENAFGNGNDRASVYTTSAWQNTDGFTLDVTFNQVAVGTRFSFGIVDANYTPSSSPWVDTSGAYGIGFAATGELTSGGDSLIFNNGTGGSQLSLAQGDVTYNTVQTLSISVNSSGWSYSLNGAPETSGNFVFDTTKSYRFIAHGQRGNPSLTGSYFSDITLSAPVASVPEPTTSVLLGLGVFTGVFVRRRNC